MKIIFISILTIFFFTNQAFTEQKIAFIDMNKIISISKPGSSILKQLTNINNKNFKFLLLRSVSCFKIEEPDLDVEITLSISMKAIFCSEKA